MNPVIPVIAGPTAVGKTAVSVALASMLNAEVLSADSRQNYAPFRIGTARPVDSEMSGIVHHLLGELDLREDYSAGIFAQRAQAIVPEIQGRGRRVVVAGGSTLYVHALIEGLSDIPVVDPAIREQLNQELTDRGSEALHAELLEVDPEFAATLDPSKSQRIVRGLEIFRGTGSPLSSFHQPPPLPDQRYRLFVLHTSRDVLYKRIDARVDDMIRDGLLDEFKAALKDAPDRSLNAWRTIGYQELFAWHDNEIDLDEAVRLIKRNSRRYAKRQLTWYKRYDDARWVNTESTSPDAVADLIKNVVDSDF